MSSQGDPDAGLKASARALGEAARRGARGHPEPERLLAYHERRLSESEAAAVRSHLVLCRECADFVLDLAAFPDVPLRVPVEEEPERLAPSWEEVLEAHAAEEGAEPRPRPLAGTGFRLIVAFAAGLCAVSLLLGWRLVSVSRELVQERAPEPNAAAARLEEPSRGGEPQWVSVPAAARRVVLAIRAPAGEVGPWRAEIAPLGGDGAGRRQQVPGLVAGGDGLLTLSLHRSRLPAGRYRLTLRREGSEESWAEYPFELRYDAGAAPGRGPGP